jgi:diaminopimelate decarboxylase
LRVTIEPGRSIVGRAGVLLTRVLYRKKSAEKEFVVVDAAMNDLIRPSLYRSHHEIIPLRKTGGRRSWRTWWGRSARPATFWRAGARWPTPRRAITWRSRRPGRTGSCSRRITTRGRGAPEVLVEGDTFRTIRARETYADLVRGEVV